MKKIILASLSLAIFGISSLVAQPLKYKVKKGESFYDIAKKHNISLEKLQVSNLKYFQKQLKYGDEIEIPLENKDKVSIDNDKLNKNSLKVLNTKSVRVEFGDSFSSFAKRHNLSIEELKKLNTEKFKGKLKYGDELLIPLSSETSLTSSKAKSSQKKDKNSDKREKKENFEVFKEKNKSKKVSEKTSSIIPTAKRKLGARYVYGAMGPYKFDCSGFTSYVFKTKGVCLPRKASAQYQRGEKVSRNNLKEGDLVFFDTDNRRNCISHVGIYAGNNKFVHASSGARKVVISNLDKDFYSKRYRGARRYICN